MPAEVVSLVFGLVDQAGRPTAAVFQQSTQLSYKLDFKL